MQTLVNENVDNSELNIPQQQTVNNETFLQTTDYIYSVTGGIVETKENNTYSDNFYVETEKNELIKISINDTKQIETGSEIGYLARILAAEALIYEKSGNYYNISLFTRICIAETIKNRKNSDFGFYKNYKSYRSVIIYTGYATYAKEFQNTQTWLKNVVAKKRFVQEVLPAAIYVYLTKQILLTKQPDLLHRLNYLKKNIKNFKIEY